MEFGPTVKDLVGKTVIIGITRLDHNKNVIDQSQFVGIFKSMDQVIHITLANGEDFTLPPDLSSFQKAKPGIYRLRSTGEEVKNPDYTASWTVLQPRPKKKKRPQRKR